MRVQAWKNRTAREPPVAGDEHDHDLQPRKGHDAQNGRSKRVLSSEFANLKEALS